MEPSRKERKTRSVFDVHGGGASPVRHAPLKERVRGANVLNLQPGFGRRHPWAAATILIAVLAGGYFGIRQITTRAEISDFYPLTCLGSWQNPSGAQGIPESLSVPGTPISAGDAAVYDPASEPLAQIYCGAFLPADFKTEGDIKSVTLTLAWDMPGFAAPTSSDNGTAVPLNATGTTVATDTAASTATASTTTDGTNGTTTNPTSTVATSSSLAPFLGNFAFFLKTAHADTTDTASTVSTSSGNSAPVPPPPPPAPAAEPTSTTAPAPAPSSTTTTTTTTSAPAAPPASSTAPAVATSTADENTATSSASSTVPMSTTEASANAATTTASAATLSATSTASATISAAPLAPATPEPDNNFLRVSYSLDGVAWTELVTVSPDNWQAFKANIPVSSWDDMKKLQIKIEGIKTSLAQIPKVYLDGMIVEARYEVTPLALPSDQGTAAPAAAPGGENGGANVIVLPPSAQPKPVNPNGSFNADQAPTFDFDMNSLQTATSGPMVSSTPVIAPTPGPAPSSSGDLPPSSTPLPGTSTATSTSLMAPHSPLSFFF